MRIRNSFQSAKSRDKNCRVVRRHGRVYAQPEPKADILARRDAIVAGLHALVPPRVSSPNSCC